MSYETMRESLRKMAAPVAPTEPPITPDSATAMASTMSKLTSSPEFQTFMAQKIKEIGKPVESLTREEYDALVGEFITPVARMFAGQ